MEYLTTSEVAEKWGITARRVVVLCKEGRIEGAVKKSRMWRYRILQISQKMVDMSAIWDSIKIRLLKDIERGIKGILNCNSLFMRGTKLVQNYYEKL